MSTPTVPDLKELFKQAAEIAEQVPENMQEAAFNRAIDLLSGVSASAVAQIDPPPAKAKRSNASPKKKAKSKKAEENDSSAASNLVALIDSTQHPGVTSATPYLERSLMVLQIALREHDIDGLTPVEIANVLTEKFRISTNSRVVSNALGLATTLVNRTKEGAGYRYKIMGPGEEHLAHYNETPKDTKPNPKKVKATKKTPTKKAQKSKKVSSKGKAKKASSKISPTTAVKDLIEGGFFVKSKTSPEIQSHLKSKRGFNFETDHLRMTMLRLVRAGKLERDENAEGQYEYQSPKK